MSPPKIQSPTGVQRRPRVRRSLAHPVLSDLDQENQLQASSTLDLPGASKENGSMKRLRSKSLGPGGLDALKETSGNRRRSVANSFQPKSILKPTIPLSPIRAIPPRQSVRTENNLSNAPNSPEKRISSSHDDKIPDTPARGASIQKSDLEADQEPRHDDSTEDAESAERRRRKAEIQKQREARRKSLAGRRVSFAPEATLHTWDTELLQDLTTSTGSADSTRRASSFSKSQAGDANRPGTPPDQVQNASTKKSPEHQRDAHKKRRRRSSGIPPMNFNDPDALSSSPFSGSSVADEEFDPRSEALSRVDTSPSPRKDLNITVDEKSSPGDVDLDASLEDAAKRAGTSSIGVDENGEISMDIAGDEVTAAFKPWVKQSMGAGSPHPSKTTAKVFAENINIFSPSQATHSGSPTPSQADSEDMSMEMTQAIGGIVQSNAKEPERQGERYPKRKERVAQRRRSSGEGSDRGGSTMNLTTAVGGVQEASRLADLSPATIDGNEELSMEFTSVVGGVKAGNSPAKRASATAVKKYASNRQPPAQGQDAMEDFNESDDMEMTEAVGSIRDKRRKPAATTSSDLTRLSKGQATRQSDMPDLQTACSSFRSRPTPRPRPSLSASATGSPAADPFARRDRLRRSANGPSDTTPEEKPSTPTRQMTPVALSERPTTPGKTPPSSAVAMRKTTPKKLFQDEIQAHKSPKSNTSRLFRNDMLDGRHTPNVILTPKPAAAYNSQGVNRGSPRMTAILDRRPSISDNADVFAPKGAARGVKFEDPRAIDIEVSHEQDQQRRQESAHAIIDQEVDGGAEEENATQSLKELMHSMTPKNGKAEGRKSLAIGSARGLLGKRPAELDDDEELSPQMFGKATSPVKRIRLQGPPSAEETMRSSRNSGQPMTGNAGNARPKTPILESSPSSKTASTPKSQGRFKDAERLARAQKPIPTMGQTAPSDAESASQEDDEGRISLQGFLNLTNIRFMELTTTKRRPTAAPARLQDSQDGYRNPENNFENAVVAGACTTPMLELFQHSCRELKKYISEGRNVVKEIESETMKENPLIFSQYTRASPSNRTTWDNQFKNMKTNARLLSKATWYEWRMKLLEGVRESLGDTSDDFQKDGEALDRQLDVVQDALTVTRERRTVLEREYELLQTRANELAACDPEDLETARERLQTVSQEIESNAHLLEKHIESMSNSDKELAIAKSVREAAQTATRDAHRQREECRGWSTDEVKKVQANVDNLVAATGWRILSTSGSQLALEMDGELILSFNSAAYLPTAAKARSNTSVAPGLSLAYTAKQQRSSELSTSQRFFLQLLRAHLHSLAPSKTHASSLLHVVASGWGMARAAEAQLTLLRRRGGITAEQIAGDEKLMINSAVLLPASQSKVNVTFVLNATTRGDEVEAVVGASTACVYGKDFGSIDMNKILQKRTLRTLGEVGQSTGDWAEGVEALKAWLVEHQ